VTSVTTVRADELVPTLLMVALGLLFELVVPQSLSHAAREVLLALLGVAVVALWRRLAQLDVEGITFAAVREALDRRLVRLH
jgi:hypothetical protein